MLCVNTPNRQVIKTQILCLRKRTYCSISAGGSICCHLTKGNQNWCCTHINHNAVFAHPFHSISLSPQSGLLVQICLVIG